MPALSKHRANHNFQQSPNHPLKIIIYYLFTYQRSPTTEPLPPQNHNILSISLSIKASFANSSILQPTRIYGDIKAANAQLHLCTIHWISSQVLFQCRRNTPKQRANDIYTIDPILIPWSVLSWSVSKRMCHNELSTASFPDIWLFAMQSSTKATSDYPRHENQPGGVNASRLRAKEAENDMKKKIQ